MSFTIEKVFTALKQKGFVQSESNPEILIFEYDPSIMLKAPINSRMLPGDLVIMAEQIKVSEAFFIDMVLCHKSGEDYIRELNKKRLSDS